MRVNFERSGEQLKLKKKCTYFWDIRLFASLSILWELACEINFLPSNSRLPPVKHPLQGLFITRPPLGNTNESLGDKWVWRTPCKPWLLLSAAPFFPPTSLMLPLAQISLPLSLKKYFYVAHTPFMFTPHADPVLLQSLYQSLPSSPTSFCQLLYIPIVICGSLSFIPLPPSLSAACFDCLSNLHLWFPHRAAVVFGLVVSRCMCILD